MLSDYQSALAAIRSQGSSKWATFLVPAGILVLIAGVWYVVR